MTEKRKRGRPPVDHGHFVDGPFVGMARHSQKLILADPPWDHRQYSAKGYDRHPSRHYPTMKLADIKAMPVGDLAAKDAFLCLWTTWPHLVEALEVMHAWGFSYSSNLLIWVKLNPLAFDKLFLTLADFHRGTGYVSRKNTEPMLLGRRGRPVILKKPDELLIAARRQHSRMPDESIRRVEAFTPGPRLELFAREERPGWTAWGNDVAKFNPDPAPYSPIKLAVPDDLITEEDLRILDYPEDQIMQFRSRVSR